MSKNKIDEAVTLIMSGSGADGVNVESVVHADDLVELVGILKNAGVASSQFNGPASLTDDSEDGCMTTISSPSLRQIMTILEPVFKAVGDMESGEESCQDCDQSVEEPVDVPVGETAEYDHGHNVTSRKGSTYDAPASLPGNADRKVRNVGKYADNALAVEAKDKSFLDYLKETEDKTK